MEFASKVADFFSALGDPTRIQILGIVVDHPLTVNEIKANLGDISLQALSYQLKKLEDQHLIRYQRDPEDQRKKSYFLADEHIAHILNDTVLHIRGGENCVGNFECDDYENLRFLKG